MLARAAEIVPEALRVRIVPHPGGVDLLPQDPAGLPPLPDDAFGGPDLARRPRVLQEGALRRLGEAVLPVPRTAHARLAWSRVPISS